MLVQRPWSANSSLCSLGCGWLCRAALRLEREQWHVRTVVPKGGVGGLLDVAESLDIGAAAPKDECIVTLCRVGDEVVLDAGRRRRVAHLFYWVDFFIFVGESRVCSSHRIHGVFSPALVRGRLVLVGWSLGLAPCGLRPCCISFSTVFH
jgi:hypothetical protein